MGTNCAPLVADLFFSFVMRETLCCLCQTIDPFSRKIAKSTFEMTIFQL